VVDHIIPVQHPYVCGLTVPWNLRVGPESCNQAKSNDWRPDQAALELIVVPEQVTLL
jgi:predicted nucleic acid-binding Zn ribbon protein